MTVTLNDNSTSVSIDRVRDNGNDSRGIGYPHITNMSVVL